MCLFVLLAGRSKDMAVLEMVSVDAVNLSICCKTAKADLELHYTSNSDIIKECHCFGYLWNISTSYCMCLETMLSLDVILQ